MKQIVQPIKKPVRTLSIFTSMAFVKDANGISFKNNNVTFYLPDILFIYLFSLLRIGECPSNSTFLKDNGAEAHCF